MLRAFRPRRLRALALALAACNPSHESPPEPAHTGATSAPTLPSSPHAKSATPHASTAAPAPGEPRTCKGWPILVGHDAEGVPRRAYVAGTRGGRKIAMELDTGSATSFVAFDLKADASVERTHETIHVAENSRTLPGRRISLDPDTYGAKERGNLPISGILGAEEVLQGTTELDLRDGCLTRYARGTELPETSTWATVPFNVVNGVMVVNVTIDTEERRALFDTGVGYSILVTDAVEPFVMHQVVHDVRGLRVDLYDRRGSVRWGHGPTEEVWVERTRAFHTFDDMKLGDVRTMVGISAMGSRRIVIDMERSLLVIEPPSQRPKEAQH